MARLSLRESELRPLRIQDRRRAANQDRVDPAPAKMHVRGGGTSLATHRANPNVEESDAAMAAGKARDPALAKVDAALKRLKSGMFRNCGGHPILAARFEAPPFARIRVKCERQHEMK